MLKEKIEKASKNMNEINIRLTGKVFATLRDKNGNVKDYREVDL